MNYFKKSLLLIFFFLLLLTVDCYSHCGPLPYSQSPNWISATWLDYSTGLGITDLNHDSWKDLVVANGNDMKAQRVVVFYNNKGRFPVWPGWKSEDKNYHAMLSLGDYNKDGWMDCAVSVLFKRKSGTTEYGCVNLYENEQGKLSLKKIISDQFYSFSCAFGDADADGDLDLAVACSDEYVAGQPYGYVKIFLNDNGTFNSKADWVSNIKMGVMVVKFADVDQNGFLDLVAGCLKTSPNYIFLANQQGQISKDPAWQSTENGMAIHLCSKQNHDQKSVDIAYANNSIFNDYTQDYLYINQFRYAEKLKSRLIWQDKLEGDYHYSMVLFADIMGDQQLELLCGGWGTRLFYYSQSGRQYQKIPCFISRESFIIEEIAVADLDKKKIIAVTETFLSDQDHYSLIYLARQNIEEIKTVYLDDQPLAAVDYCSIPNDNWISVYHHRIKKGSRITVQYTYSKSLDIVATNFRQKGGNVIFFHNQ